MADVDAWATAHNEATASKPYDEGEPPLSIAEIALGIMAVLERVATAQERMLALSEADFDGMVRAEVEKRLEGAVNAKIEENTKRNYIGKNNG